MTRNRRPPGAEGRAEGDAAGEERDLVARMRRGDARAFDEFADHYVPALYRFAASRLAGDRELTRDLVQATLCKAIERIGGWRGEAPLLTWLCACCRNEIAMYFRRKGSRPVLAVPGEGEAGEPEAAESWSPETRTIEREERDRVHQALDVLPPRYASALEWKYLEEMPVEEIGRRLEITPKAAESLLTRARGAFRSAYEALLDERGNG